MKATMIFGPGSRKDTAREGRKEGPGHPHYIVGLPTFQSLCSWAVFPHDRASSICYCTDRARAELVAKALNEWARKHEKGEKA